MQADLEVTKLAVLVGTLDLELNEQTVGGFKENLPRELASQGYDAFFDETRMREAIKSALEDIFPYIIYPRRVV